VSPVPPVQPRIRRNLIKRTRNQHSQTAPVPSSPRTTAPKKRFTLPLVFSVQPGTGTQSIKRPKELHSQAASVPSIPRTTAPKKRFTLSFPRIGRRNHEQMVDPPSAENAIVTPPWGWQVQAPPDVAHPTCPEAPPLSPSSSTHHDSNPSDWKYMVSGLIDSIFSDSDEVKAIGRLHGDDAQNFTDMVYEVYLCAVSSSKTTTTNFRSGFRSGIGVS